MQLNSILISQELTMMLKIQRHFSRARIPYSNNEIFVNKLLSCLNHFKRFSNEAMDSYWITDETSVLKRLFCSVQSFNKSQLSVQFQLKLKSIYDCFIYSDFQSYVLIQQNKNYTQTAYSDDESQEEENIQKKDRENISTFKNIIIIINLQHCVNQNKQSIRKMLSYFNTKKIIPLFLSQFTNSQLEDVLKTVAYKSQLSLSQNVFKDIFISSLDLLKKKFYSKYEQIEKIKDHQSRLLMKLTFNNKYNKNQTYQKIQNLLENNQEVLELINSFNLLQNNLNRVLIIRNQLYKPKSDHINQEVIDIIGKFYQENKNKQGNLQKQNLQKSTSKNLSLSSVQSIQNLSSQTDITKTHSNLEIRWTQHISFHDLLNKHLIKDYCIFSVLIQLKNSCRDKPEDQANKFILSYLTLDHREIVKHLNKFRQFLAQENAKYQLKSQNSSSQKALKINFRFSQVINCLIIENSSALIIEKLKQDYPETLIIIDSSSQKARTSQLPINSGDLLMYYTKRNQLLLLSDSVFQARNLLRFVERQLQEIIYRKCINQRQMDARELIKYLNEEEEFKIFVILNQKYIENSQQKIIQPWSRFDQEIQSFKILKQFEHQNLEGLDLVKCIFQELEKLEEEKFIIEASLKTYYNTI